MRGAGEVDVGDVVLGVRVYSDVGGMKALSVGGVEVLDGIEGGPCDGCGLSCV